MRVHKQRPKLKFDDPAQSQRFIDMARKVIADESRDALERAFATVVLRKLRRTKVQTS